MITLYTNQHKNNILSADLTQIHTAPKQLPKSLLGDMTKLCREKKGVGLAANQISLRENLFFVAASVKLLPAPVGQLCINPSWEPACDADKITHYGEGCLSLPGRVFTTQRWATIDAQWTNTQGHLVKRKLRGLAAQVFQHEHDHLRGLTLEVTGSEE
jgi:peptide deformylase